MEIKKPILIISIIYIIFVITFTLVYRISYDKLNKKYNKALDELNYYHNIDTNVVHKVDSIEYNIQIKDSIIYELKKEYINEIEIVKANNDIDALNQFKKLVSSK